MLPDAFGSVTQDGKFVVFTYEVGRNLLFSAAETGTPFPPAKRVTAIALYDGSVPHAHEKNGSEPLAGFVLGNEAPHCLDRITGSAPRSTN